MSAQEAAWYLLRQPMSEASRKVNILYCFREMLRNTYLHFTGGVSSDNVATRADKISEAF